MVQVHTLGAAGWRKFS